MSMVKIAVAFALGTQFGMAIMCCLAVAGRADRDTEQNNRDKTDIS